MTIYWESKWERISGKLLLVPSVSLSRIRTFRVQQHDGETQGWPHGTLHLSPFNGGQQWEKWRIEKNKATSCKMYPVCSAVCFLRVPSSYSQFNQIRSRHFLLGWIRLLWDSSLKENKSGNSCSCFPPEHHRNDRAMQSGLEVKISKRKPSLCCYCI